MQQYPIMNTEKNNYQPEQNQKPNNNGFDWRLVPYITVHGIATGCSIQLIREMIANGYDRNTTITLLLYLLSVVYTAQRAYQTYQQNKNNNKTR